MKGFLSCNHPKRINTLKGLKLVACGKCIQCITAKRRKTELLLSIETSAHKYCELINLTYSDDFLPYVDMSAINGDYSYLGSTFDDYMRTWLPVHFGDRQKRIYNPRDKKYHYVHDTRYDNVRTNRFGVLERYGDFDTFLTTPINDMLFTYNKRIDEYYQKYPFRHRGTPRQKNHVAILWTEDLQLFIDRLRAYIKKQYGTEVRYFACGEYGTNSLRPHWHIVLFHDSPRLRCAFENVYVYPNSTRQNPRECAYSLFESSLWQFGDITTTPTDGHASSYLSGYLNQSSSLPKLLNAFPQKTFKSIFLGAQRNNEQIATLLKSRRFRELTTSYVVSRKNVVRPVPSPSSCYSRFHIGFSFDGLQTLTSKYTLLCRAKHFLERTQINVFDDKEVYDAFRWLSRSRDCFTSIDYAIYRPLCDYVNTYCIKVYEDKRSVNPLKSVFYAAIKLYKIANSLSLQSWSYLKLVDDFEKWYDYQNLITHLKMLEDNPVLSYQYYSTFDNVLGIPDFDKYKSTSYFINQQSLANMDYYSSIKHKEIVQTYKTDL